MALKEPHRIAVLRGDGIGKEVMPEGVRVLEAVARRCKIALTLDWMDLGSCDYYLRNGSMLPEDWLETLKGYDAILFGAVGWPQSVPDHISLWGSLLQFRRIFDQYVNLRPVRLLPGVPTPLARRAAGEIDFCVVRENTEGEYSSIGGRAFENTNREIVIQETVMSRVGIDRIVEYAFELPRRRPKRHLTSATKSNGLGIPMPYWDERVAAVATGYPDVRSDRCHIDALAANFVLHPDRFDVVVASNLFGDILSDLGAACAGTLGIAPSANIDPSRANPSLFEPVHGSAPDIAGQGIANPIGQIWAAAMMLEHLGEFEASNLVIAAIERVLCVASGRTRDLGGTLTTEECGRAVANEI